nr:MAG TPA: hypothetical protein [Caudoviricetes sp.]
MKTDTKVILKTTHQMLKVGLPVKCLELYNSEKGRGTMYLKLYIIYLLIMTNSDLTSLLLEL